MASDTRMATNGEQGRRASRMYLLETFPTTYFAGLPLTSAQHTLLTLTTHFRRRINKESKQSQKRNNAKQSSAGEPEPPHKKAKIVESAGHTGSVGANDNGKFCVWCNGNRFHEVDCPIADQDEEVLHIQEATVINQEVESGFENVDPPEEVTSAAPIPVAGQATESNESSRPNFEPGLEEFELVRQEGLEGLKAWGRGG